MKLRSVVWVALVAIVVGSVSAVAQNPMGGPDDVPYFSDVTGTPKTYFNPGENIYVSYFETLGRDYNNSTNTPDTMYVSVDSQSTELCVCSPVVSGTITDGPTDPDAIPGNSASDTHVTAGCAGNAAMLALVETGNDTFMFIGDVGNTPVFMQPGDVVQVGLTANDQDTAYIGLVFTGGTTYMWFDSIANADPGTRGWNAAGNDPGAGNPGDGAYGPTDEMVWEVTDYGFCGGGPYPAGVWYYRLNGGGWAGFVPTAHGGTYPTWKIGFVPPGTAHGTLVEYLYDPTGTPAVGATPVFGDTIIDQPVDLADNTYSGPPAPTLAPDDGCAGFHNEYMTINQANADVAVTGNDSWIGVHADGSANPNIPDYDYQFDTFPVNIDAARDDLTIWGAGPAQPIVVIDNGAGVGFDIQANADDVVIDFLDVRSDAAGGVATFLVQLTNAPSDTTIQNSKLNITGQASMAVSVGAAGSMNLGIDSCEFRGTDAGDGLVWLGGSTGNPNANPTITNNTFDGPGGTNGYGFEGVGLTNATIDNNTFRQCPTGVYLLSSDGGTAIGNSNGVTITRNTFTGSDSDIQIRGVDANGAVTNVLIEGNVLNGNTYGVRIRDTNSTIDTANIQLLYNQITGHSTLGVSNEDVDATLLDAQLNWWGSTAGPTHAAGNANGAGDGSSNNVDYRPWTNGAPFAGVGITLADNNNGAVQGNKTVEANSWYWTINQALAATHALGCIGAYCRTVTIDVAPGTYAEEIVFGYTNIAGTTLRATGGKAVTNIEAGADTTIIDVTNAQQSLQLGDGGTPDIGFTIYFDAAAVPAPTANKIDHLGSVLSIFDCDVLGTTGYGIHVNSASAGGRIVRTLVDDCDTAGIWLELVGGANFDIDDCTITNGGIGIDIDSGANTIINCLIQFNTFHGIDLASNGNTVGGSGNIIRNNAQNGLLIVAQGTVVSGNTIHNNGDRGIDITGNNNTFNNNMVTSNAAQGVILRGTSTGNVFNTDESAANTNCIYDNDSDGSNNNEQMRNLNTATTVDATHNFWGSASGPFNAMNNPSGDMNNRITDFIDATPFALTCGGGTADATTSLSCGAGWYLTSVPLVPGDPIAENVYNALPVFAAYQYNPATGLYVDLTGANIGWEDGYWLWLMGNETITVVGGEVTTNQTITLGATGWQQFSVPSVDIPVQPGMLGGSYPVPAGAPDMMFSGDGGATWVTYVDAYVAGWIAEGIYRWDPCAGTEGAYVMMSQQNAVLDPWFGYWIETLVPGVQVQIPVAYWVANPWTFPTRYLPAPQAITGTNGHTPPPPPPTPVAFVAAIDPATGIAVVNEPNPVRDVNTTTFRVMAIDPVEAILVQIFDQAGVLVFEETQAGDELVWHTDNDYGEFLANGVYLYRVSAWINGRWIVTGVRKLAIFR